jgi:DNA polymerase-3 subunit alpha
VAAGSQPPEVARLLADFPPRRESTEAGDVWQGLPVRLLLERRKDGVGVMAQLQLGEQAKFYPSDAALAGWMAQADEGRAQVVYD